MEIAGEISQGEGSPSQTGEGGSIAQPLEIQDYTAGQMEHGEQDRISSAASGRVTRMRWLCCMKGTGNRRCASPGS